MLPVQEELSTHEFCMVVTLLPGGPAIVCDLELSQGSVSVIRYVSETTLD